jgi:hypothetical protein
MCDLVLSLFIELFRWLSNELFVIISSTYYFFEKDWCMPLVEGITLYFSQLKHS